MDTIDILAGVIGSRWPRSAEIIGETDIANEGSIFRFSATNKGGTKLAIVAGTSVAEHRVFLSPRPMVVIPITKRSYFLD
jgi:hypothetical protein